MGWVSNVLSDGVLAVDVCYNRTQMSPIKVDPEIMSGTPCFRGTRVPVRSLFDYLEHGRSIEQFLQQFPSVSREQVTTVLEIASERVMASAAAGQ